jgi:hypothetical protein
VACELGNIRVALFFIFSRSIVLGILISINFLSKAEGFSSILFISLKAF